MKISNNETRPSTKILKARLKNTSDLKIAKKSTSNFIIKINELTK
jgi:hypothetical protein